MGIIGDFNVPHVIIAVPFPMLRCAPGILHDSHTRITDSENDINFHVMVLWSTFDRFPFKLLPSPMEWPYICYCSRWWWWYHTIIIIRAVILNKFPNAPRLYGGYSTLGFSFIHPIFHIGCVPNVIWCLTTYTMRTVRSPKNPKRIMMELENVINFMQKEYSFAEIASHFVEKRREPHTRQCVPMSIWVWWIFAAALRLDFSLSLLHRASHIAQVIYHTRAAIHKQIISASAHCFPLWAFLLFPVWNSRRL